MENVKRVFVEKKNRFNTESKNILKDLKENLGITSLSGMRILARYDISGLNDDDFKIAVESVLSEPPVDIVFFKNIPLNRRERVLAVEYIPGQYDQRGDSAAQCIQILTLKDKPIVRTAKIFIFSGDLEDEDFNKIRKYLVNPVDSKEASLRLPAVLKEKSEKPARIVAIKEFCSNSREEMESFRSETGISISTDDLLFCRDYFRDVEKRDPTKTEIKIIDTYWSDHCRHTTFETILENIEFEDSKFNKPLKEVYVSLLKSFEMVNAGVKKPLTLMSLATMSMKEMGALGKLDDLEVSEEINACSIERDVVVNGKNEKWLIMFKNETHNHPTEIEPFGGAATCLGGAIRDPLSGRAFVYQSMRITGSGDPREKIENTLFGKLPQRKITREAANGFSSYGNQIGLATGIVNEIYDEGYIAKRMEVGAVIGAVPKKFVRRGKPVPGDLIILVGGRTGRDGIGGATGSSMEHDEKSVEEAGAEVQKGNAPEERKLQRLFRKKEVIRLIKRSNDFGAGGVSVAVGELADGVVIDLDSIPKKYEGLNGTELALSESQERMAVVIEKKDADDFIRFSEEENLEATVIAEVTSGKRLIMFWRGDKIVDIARDFLDTSGIRQKASVLVNAPDEKLNYFKQYSNSVTDSYPYIKKKWLEIVSGLNGCSQRGLKEMFDGTVGAGTVLMPSGGKFNATPTESMAALIPVLNGESETSTVMSFGFSPKIMRWSPFHGGLYSVVEAVSKIVAAGGKYSMIRMSLQEYFEKLGKSREKWGKPFAALMGAYYAMKMFGIAAIGGKDSMSGTFIDKSVPPTLIAFGVDTVDVDRIISPELKGPGNSVVAVLSSRDEYEVPDFKKLKLNFEKIRIGIGNGDILSAHTIGEGGVALAIAKMSFGNRIGVKFQSDFDKGLLFFPAFGSVVLELKKGVKTENFLKGTDYTLLGETIAENKFVINGKKININKLYEKWSSILSGVFPFRSKGRDDNPELTNFKERIGSGSSVSFVKPRVMIPVFPGTNCEFDMAKAFENEGAVTVSTVFKNLTSKQIKESIEVFKNEINNSQIIAIPGGFSAGDEPDGSGKFIAAVFRNNKLSDAIMDLLYKRDGLILGICNGFQALIKLGLLPNGEIGDLDENSPTLTFNLIGRHVSKMVETKVVSVLSPWLTHSDIGDVHTIPVSHGEGRFTAKENIIKELERKGQIATQYVNYDGVPTYDSDFNPNGSDFSIEGITSPDGRVFGKMGHSERVGDNLYKNIHGKWDMSIFRSGVNYFK